MGDYLSKYSFTIDAFKNIQEMIRFMDQKSSAMLVIFGFILTTFVNTASRLNFINPFILPWWNGILSSLTFLIGLATLILMLLKIKILVNDILRPRKAVHYLPENISLFYYEHIKLLGKDQYVSEIYQMPEERAEQEIAEQIYEISHILSIKTNNLHSVMTGMFYTVGLLLLFIFLGQLV